MYKNFASISIIVIALYFMALVAASYLLHPVRIELVFYPTERKAEIPTFMLPIVGCVLVLPLLAIASSALDKINPLPPVLFFAAVLDGLGAAFGQLSWAAAAIVFALGAGAFACAWTLVVMLRMGETLEIESRWSGLGGGLGGWRLSRAAGMALLALVLVTGSVVAVLPHGPPEPKAGEPKAGEATQHGGSAETHAGGAEHGKPGEAAK